MLATPELIKRALGKPEFGMLSTIRTGLTEEDLDCEGAKQNGICALTVH